MSKIDLSKYKIDESDGVFTFKNENTTLGFVRFNSIGEVEYIFVNPLFRSSINPLKESNGLKVRSKTGGTSAFASAVASSIRT